MSNPTPEIRIVHIESEEEVDVSRIGELEEIFADLLFENWLGEKGFQKWSSRLKSNPS